MKKTLLLDATEITIHVKNLAFEIKKHYEALNKPLAIISILKGSYVFTADLTRHLYPLPLTIDFLHAASYKGASSTGTVEFLNHVPANVIGRDLLIVEDVLDTGLTLNKVLKDVQDLCAPSSLGVCSLLQKQTFQWPKDFNGKKFVGVTVPDKFLVGYGLDFDQAERHSPDIFVLED